MKIHHSRLLGITSCLICLGLSGCMTARTLHSEISNASNRDPETQLVWPEPRIGTTQGNNYIPPSGELLIGLPKTILRDARMRTYPTDSPSDFTLTVFEYLYGSLTVTGRTPPPSLDFKRIFSDPDYAKYAMNGFNMILMEQRPNASLRKQQLNPEEKSIFSVYFIPEGSSTRVNGKRVDTLIGVLNVAIRGKIFWIIYEPSPTSADYPYAKLEEEVREQFRRIRPAGPFAGSFAD